MSATDDPKGGTVTEPEQFQEGEEAPPPGVRTMAIVRWALVAVMALAAVVSILSYAGVSIGRQVGGAGDGTTYYCPMHPQIVQDHPGTCPVCNMNLVPRAKGAKGPIAPSATMAPAAAVTDAGASAGRYYCPMHPHVASDDPNAKCDLCGGMKLLPRPGPDGGAAPGTAPQAGVPGLVPVELPTDRVQLIGMKTAVVARAAIGGELRATAAIAPDERRLAQVTPRFAGYIERLVVAETGRRVGKGEVLATIYSPEVMRAQQELLAARRWAEAAPPPAAAPGAHHALGGGLDDDARRRLLYLGVDAQEIERIVRTGKPLEALPLRSPFDGTVVGKSAVAGAAVQPGVPLFEIANLTTVWAIAELYESEIGRVRVGQRATLTLPAYPGERFEGKVAFVDPLLDPAARTLRVRIELPNRRSKEGPKLRPGMYGAVTLALPGATALVAPREAVVDTGELQYVFVVAAPGRFEPRRVRTGSPAGDRVEIVEGLREGETVVTTANFLLDSESRLRAAIEGRAASAPPPAGAPPGHEGHQ